MAIYAGPFKIFARNADIHPDPHPISIITAGRVARRSGSSFSSASFEREIERRESAQRNHVAYTLRQSTQKWKSPLVP